MTRIPIPSSLFLSLFFVLFSRSFLFFFSLFLVLSLALSLCHLFYCALSGTCSIVLSWHSCVTRCDARAYVGSR